MYRTRAAAGVLLAVGFVSAILGLLPAASAAGVGYNLSFAQAPSSVDPAVDLLSLTTADTGSTVTVTLTVAGQIDLASSLDFYFFYSGGAALSNASTYAEFTGSATGVWFSTAAGATGYGNLAGTVGSSGSSLQFSLNKTALPPAASFTANAEAYTSTGGSASGSWIGSDYPASAGGPCVHNCTTASSGSSTAWWVLPAVLTAGAAAVVVAALVVVLVLSRRRPPPSTVASVPPPAPPTPPAP